MNDSNLNSALESNSQFFKRNPRKLAARWAGLIAILSIVPLGALVIPTFSYQDKVFHFLFYVPLGYLGVAALRYSAKPHSRLYAFVLATLFAGVFGLSLEIVQYLTSWRSFSLLDALANVIGAAVGSGSALLWIPSFFKGKE